jgi:hypothetical protein
MPAPKFRQVLKDTYALHSELFEALRPVHDAYVADRKGKQEELNRLGAPVMDILKEAEQRLCRQTETGGYGQYSSKLADKFWTEVKKDWPYIEWIGVKIVSA